MSKIIDGQIEFELEYLHVEKMSGEKRSIKVTHRALETIVECLSDYSCLVYEESKNHPENVLLTMKMKEKVKELNSIMLTIAKGINYN